MRVLDAYPIIADRFENVAEVKGGAEAIATCPLGHMNAKVTFSVGKEGQLIVHCFRCGKTSTLEILRAAKMSYKDCFPGQQDWQTVRREIVARYPYKDEKGVLLYETIRMEPGYGGADKTFRQRRPAGKSWEWNLDGVRRVLYRLPELISPKNAGRTILIVAGEKDADNLAAIGVLATTNVNGERSEWIDDYSRCLGNRDIVVIEDRDEAGKRHANEVVGSLIVHNAASVRRLALPEKDATAFLNGLRQKGVTGKAELQTELSRAIRAANLWVKKSA